MFELGIIGYVVIGGCTTDDDWTNLSDGWSFCRSPSRPSSSVLILRFKSSNLQV
ncbi:hypothetical protein SERLA73DRAFT_174339 [Serpula lacrymans var. lacrymans S7.3]|uniref:Uncharacterized protein n=1 Tax=Serpula lacrymans var. lacrymans (strain S7.3) TaxID=936435 RepID=F8PF76_SERL3|nr:hypothetical protein SERLA73DRAFT_174339 [Serpula lacrymans var. lacrymans S7.3]